MDKYIIMSKFSSFVPVPLISIFQPYVACFRGLQHRLFQTILFPISAQIHFKIRRHYVLVHVFDSKSIEVPLHRYPLSPGCALVQYNI